MPNVEPLREGDPAAVGPYRLVGRLGAGGHGVVYLGQARNGTPVAVKVLREGLAVGDRLAKEIAAARKVEPFCLAQVLDASTGGRPYIVSEYVDGLSLQQAGRSGGAELQRLAVATATALDAIHQAGVVHGDFTPANVLLGPDGARVVDFGIAGALGSGMKATSNIVGTPAYMAPEQLAGRPVGAAADVFSWASVLVFAATGVPPFGDDSLPAVINRILREEPVLGELGRPLREVVTVCLAKDPAARPSMRDVLLRLAAPSRRPAAPQAAPQAAPGGSQPSDPSTAWEDTVDHPIVRPPLPDSHLPRRRATAAHDGADTPAAHPSAAGPVHQHDRTQQHDQAQQHGPAQQHEWAQQHGWAQAHDPGQQHERTPQHEQHGWAQAHEPAQEHGWGRQGQGAGHEHDRSPQPGRPSAQDGGPVQEGSPLQALFDLSSPVEPPAPAAPDRDPQGVHPPHPQETFGGPGARHPQTGQFEAGQYETGQYETGQYAAGHEEQAGHGDEQAAHQEPGEAAPRPRRSKGRTAKKVLIAGLSGVSVCALGAAIVWLTPTTPTPKTKKIAVVGATTAAATEAAEPGTTPTPGRTRNRPTPQTNGTPSPVPTGAVGVSGTPAATADRLRVVYVRPGGTNDGECWAGGEVTLQALVRRTGAQVNFTYAWIIDGALADRATATIGENGVRYLTAPDGLKSAGGTHDVTLRITSPVNAQRTVEVTMCEDGTTY